MARGVIFDVDGTLVDSVDLHARAWQDAFREFGHNIDFHDIRQQIGKGGDQLMPVFLAEAELATIGGPLESRRAEILKQRYMDEIRGFPGVRELIKKLLTNGNGVALASSAKKDELQVYKRVAQIDDLISTETTSDDAEKSKPHPDIFQAALEKLNGVGPDDILVVGDSPYDAEAAGKLGLRTIGVLCGGFSEPQLREAGCMAIYRDPADLLAHYDQSPFADSRAINSRGGDAMSNVEFTNSHDKTAGGGGSVSDLARRTGEQARHAGGDAVNQARDVASEAQSRISSLAGSVGEQAKSIGEAQKDSAAEALENVAKAVHKSAEQLHGQQDWAARLIERGAAELNTLATSLRRNDVQGLVDNLGSLARRQPAIFVGASMAAGFLLTRIGRLAVENPPESGTGMSAQPSSTPLTQTLPSSMETFDGQR